MGRPEELDESKRPSEDAEPPTAEPPPGRRRWVLVAAALGVVLVLALAGTLAALHWRTTPPAPHAAGAVEPIADGSDPNRAGCGSGAVTLAHVNVHFPATALAGELELRYSSRCRAAWSRFEPAPSWHPGDGVVVTVRTVRPADQATQHRSVPFAGETITGNMLMTLPGCIVVEVSMVQGTATSPVATIGCQRIGS